jgi:hypothetical protein
MSKALQFIGIDDLLTDIGRGIGSANRELAVSSRSVIGSLAVKSASVNLSFEMTSTASQRRDSVSAGGPLFGAKTLSIGTQTFDQNQTNRCTIGLEIVAVPDAASAPPGVPKPDRPDVPKPDAPGADARRIPDDPGKLRVLLAELRRLAKDLQAPEHLKKEIDQDLEKLEQLLGAGAIEELRSGLLAFAEKYRGLFEGMNA